jgi:hypothetical protein
VRDRTGAVFELDGAASTSCGTRAPPPRRLGCVEVARFSVTHVIGWNASQPRDAVATADDEASCHSVSSRFRTQRALSSAQVGDADDRLATKAGEARGLPRLRLTAVVRVMLLR